MEGAAICESPRPLLRKSRNVSAAPGAYVHADSPAFRSTPPMSSLRPIAALACLLSLNACKGSAGPGAAGGKADPVVARVGGGTITASRFQARLEEQPPILRSRYTTLESKKAFLDNLVRFELL